ncbi:unnamed protein product [Allacma fusca]|uniref:Uncharacterized protein n=1 Tax=Allacma fusca TaxID=39272 RepID=A0A8J2JJ49_9HEXA|nr:unnamed protein product [Allacma fusca]
MRVEILMFDVIGKKIYTLERLEKYEECTYEKGFTIALFLGPGNSHTIISSNLEHLSLHLSYASLTVTVYV